MIVEETELKICVCFYLHIVQLAQFCLCKSPLHFKVLIRPFAFDIVPVLMTQSLLSDVRIILTSYFIIFRMFVKFMLSSCVFLSPTSTALTQRVILAHPKLQLLSTPLPPSQESWRTTTLIQTKQVRPVLSKERGREREDKERQTQHSV